MTDLSASKADFLAVLETAQAYLASITRPCPECGGKPWRDDERARICPICDTYFHDDDGMGAMMDIQALVRALHA
jgi:hypothetical protein